MNVQICDNQVGAKGIQGGHFVHSTLNNPTFHIHTPAEVRSRDESSLLTTDPRRRPSAEEELLRPKDKRKKSDEEIEVENQGEIQFNCQAQVQVQVR